MRGSDIVTIDGVGPVLFESSRRARRIIISAKPFAGLRVAVPYGTSRNEALSFALRSTGWMKRQLARTKEMEEEHLTLSASIGEIDRKGAKKELTRRLNLLSKRYGLPYNRVFIRNQKTLWGSCSAKKNINLNIELVTLPGDLVDYVITHELVHTRHLHHGEDFWRELANYLPEPRSFAKRLRQHKIRASVKRTHAGGR